MDCLWAVVNLASVLVLERAT